MKKALVALAIAGFASSAMAMIANSKHDLNKSGLGYNGAIPQIGSCQFCHAPHYGNTQGVTGGSQPNTGYGQIPLWNRREPSTAGYILRTPISGAVPKLGAGSFACLSCHDGVSDLGQTYRGSTGFTTTGMKIGNGALISANVGLTYNGVAYVNGGGTDLSDDHPVGIPYAGGAGYNAANVVDNGTASRTLRLYPSAFTAGQSTVECGSCHDPHVTVASGMNFMRVNMQTVDICGVCHTK
jgi:predicted CXXCH cytochrome family protein